MLSKEQLQTLAETEFSTKHCYTQDDVNCQRAAQMGFIFGYHSAPKIEWKPVDDTITKERSYIVKATSAGSIFVMYYGLTNKGTYGWYYNDEEVKPYMIPTECIPTETLKNL